MRSTNKKKLRKLKRKMTLSIRQKSSKVKTEWKLTNSWHKIKRKITISPNKRKRRAKLLKFPTIFACLHVNCNNWIICLNLTWSYLQHPEHSKCLRDPKGTGVWLLLAMEWQLREILVVLSLRSSIASFQVEVLLRIIRQILRRKILYHSHTSPNNIGWVMTKTWQP